MRNTDEQVTAVQVWTRAGASSIMWAWIRMYMCVRICGVVWMHKFCLEAANEGALVVTLPCSHVLFVSCDVELCALVTWNCLGHCGESRHATRRVTPRDTERKRKRVTAFLSEPSPCFSNVNQHSRWKSKKKKTYRLLCGSIDGWGGESRNVHPKFYT